MTVCEFCSGGERSSVCGTEVSTIKDGVIRTLVINIEFDAFNSDDDDLGKVYGIHFDADDRRHFQRDFRCAYREHTQFYPETQFPVQLWEMPPASMREKYGDSCACPRALGECFAAGELEEAEDEEEEEVESAVGDAEEQIAALTLSHSSPAIFE